MPYKSLFISILFVFILQTMHSQPIREFRGLWVATVGNIDWPSQKGLDAQTQQREFLDIVAKAKKNNFNALIVQIRPAADAFYASPYENWSRYLSGKQGEAPSPYYDPLLFMIEACHKQAIEFHAWFNPYRALVDAKNNVHTSQHITYLHPEWFVNYGGKKYFNPGIPEVQQYFTKIVLDVVKRYDIDAVHFDDYFYPYRIAGSEFPDQKAFIKYGYNFISKDDWRRNNVNELIQTLSKQIKSEKSYVKFGISPFGVWRNSNKDPMGSATTAGQTNYDDLFADVLLWQKKGWIDYILPQLYWEQGHKAADYNTLLTWWSKHGYNKHVYIGHATYQLSNTAKKLCWRNNDEIKEQINLLRNEPNIHGSAYYNASSIMKNACNINECFQKEVYTHPALMPDMPWLQTKLPVPSVTLKPIIKSGSGNKLAWESTTKTNSYIVFAIYKHRKNESLDFNNPIQLIGITGENTFTDESAYQNGYTYCILSMDRLQRAGEKSNEESI
ncbi:MAG: family 10 glycosylhydrolase [Chitinophagaceae bacterium]